MADLYKGIAGSPITYLTADISANQTTISIADDSALPDAPNICTIGYGEHLETIKYGAKSNGVLQNVTRGIEGTPRAWPAGTEVARFFTAYDHNAIIENLNSHLSKNSGKHITESGANANGRYIKFDDGTCICYREVAFNLSNLNTGLNSLEYDLPIVTSYAIAITNVTVVTGDVNVFNSLIVRNAGRIESGKWRRIVLEKKESMYTNEVHLSLFAIGRWK